MNNPVRAACNCASNSVSWHSFKKSYSDHQQNTFQQAFLDEGVDRRAGLISKSLTSPLLLIFQILDNFCILLHFSHLFFSHQLATAGSSKLIS